MQAFLVVYATQKHFFRASPLSALESTAQVSLTFFPNFTQNLMLIHCSKNLSFIFVTRHRNMHILSVPQLPHNWCYCAEIVTGES
jgi:hypothetical protein